MWGLGSVVELLGGDEKSFCSLSLYLSFSLSFFLLYLDKGKERKVLPLQKEVNLWHTVSRYTVCRLYKIILFSIEISIGVISGFNIAKGF